MVKDPTANHPFPVRRRLPETRPSVTVKVRHHMMEGYVTVGFYPDTNQPGEVFIQFAKQGSLYSAALDQVAILASFMLQHGLTLGWILKKMRNHRFEPMDKIDRGPEEYHLEEGSMFDAVAAAIAEACSHYGADLEKDLYGRDYGQPVRRECKKKEVEEDPLDKEPT